MSLNKDDIKERFKEKRPNLSPSSLKTYISLISSLYRKLDGKGGLDFFDNHEKIIEEVRTWEKDQSKKTALSALYVFTSIKEYQDEMNDNIKRVNEFYREQRNNPERESRALSYEDIQLRHNEIEHKYKMNPTINNTVDLLISYLFSGICSSLPPRRLEYCTLKIRNYDVETDNCLHKGRFIFNQYKTHARYGRQTIEVPKQLLVIIKKWMKVTDGDYLLINERDEPFSSTALSKKVSRLFEGNSVDMLRSAYLSYYYRNMPQLRDMEQLASNMGHSIHAAMSYYVKK